ncbi:MAG: hypothetical protein AB7R55_02205 [Gemmatimonadales bacterium]
MRFALCLLAVLGLSGGESLVAQARTRLAPTDLVTRAKPSLMSGRYRVMVLGAHVRGETVDDPLQLDGKRDEIYFAARVQQFDRRDGQRLGSILARTAVMGDVNGHPSRVKAGTASAQGGIRSGDRVPGVPDVGAYVAQPTSSLLPLLVWEGELRDGIDVLLVQPEVWEWDGGASAFNTWVSRTDELTLADPPVQQLLAAGQLTLTRRHTFDIGRHGPGIDRPIGALEHAVGLALWEQSLVVLTREVVEAAYRAGAASGRPPLTVEVRRMGDTRVTTYPDGDYFIYLRVERVP